jgi:hypothetical protein
VVQVLEGLLSKPKTLSTVREKKKKKNQTKPKTKQRVCLFKFYKCEFSSYLAVVRENTLSDIASINLWCQFDWIKE